MAPEQASTDADQAEGIEILRALNAKFDYVIATLEEIQGDREFNNARVKAVEDLCGTLIKNATVGNQRLSHIVGKVDALSTRPAR